MPEAAALTEAFLWSAQQTVTKTATVTLHGNTYQVEAALVGRKVELMLSSFNLEHIQVRYRDKTYGKAVPHTITRHTHPKAKPESPDIPTVPGTGIDYLKILADTHHHQVAGDDRIGFHALYPPLGNDHPGQLPGQLSIDHLITEITDSAGNAGDVDSGEAGQVPA